MLRMDADEFGEFLRSIGIEPMRLVMVSVCLGRDEGASCERSLRWHREPSLASELVGKLHFDCC